MHAGPRPARRGRAIPSAAVPTVHIDMRILHVLAPAEYGGLERIVEALARGHSHLGHSIGLALCLPPEEHHSMMELRDEGIEVHPISTIGRQYGRERKAIGGLIDQFQPDIVHTHGYRPDVLVPGIAQKRGVPIVSTVHGFTGGDWKNNLYESMQRWSFRRFDTVIAVSHRLGEQLIQGGVGRDRVHVLPNAWGETSAPLPGHVARAELAVPPGVLHIGWVGRVSREKGVDVLLESLPMLADLPLHVTVIGDGPDLERSRERLAKPGLKSRVKFLGAIPSAGRLFSAFDIFVLSSRTEGTPITLFEAMAAGVPVVATAVGGVPDVVSECEAWLVPAEDPAMLADAIRAVVSDPAAVAERVRAAQARLRDKFDLGAWLDRYLEVYERVRSPIKEASLCPT
ncbi:MAG: glycosyltransferase [Gemmatimonas sp.]|nr:glycosyltransferase [Gemmatimonas sp.]